MKNCNIGAIGALIFIVSFIICLIGVSMEKNTVGFICVIQGWLFTKAGLLILATMHDETIGSLITRYHYPSVIG